MLNPRYNRLIRHNNLIIFFTFSEILIILFILLAPSLLLGYKLYELAEFFAANWMWISAIVLVLIIIASILFIKYSGYPFWEVIRLDLLFTPILLYIPMCLLPGIIAEFHMGFFAGVIAVFLYPIMLIIMVFCALIGGCGFLVLMGIDEEDNRGIVLRTIETVAAVGIEVFIFVSMLGT